MFDRDHLVPENLLRRLCFFIVTKELLWSQKKMHADRKQRERTFYENCNVLAKEEQQDHKPMEDRRRSSLQSLIDSNAGPDAIAVRSYRRDPRMLYLHGDEGRQPMTMFDLMITIVIVVNTLVLAAHHRDIDPTTERGLEIANNFFLGVFTVEIMLKMMAFGVDGYFADNWNRFDFLIVVLSFVGLATAVGGSITALRVIRVAKLSQFIKTHRGLRRILRTLVAALPIFGNVIAIVMFTFFIFAVIGVAMFGKVRRNGVLDRVMNFETVPNGMIVLFVLRSSDMWIDMMEACSIKEPECSNLIDDCGTKWAPLYFCCFMVVGTFVVMQLFIAIVVDAFTDQPTTSLTDLMDGAFLTLKYVWKMKVGANTTSALPDILLKIIPLLPSALTDLPLNPNLSLVLGLLTDLQLPLSPDQEVMFVDVVYYFARRVYHIDESTLTLLVFQQGFNGTKSPFNAAEYIAAVTLQRKWKAFRERQGKEVSRFDAGQMQRIQDTLIKDRGQDFIHAIKGALVEKEVSKSSHTPVLDDGKGDTTPSPKGRDL